ncbi:MAG: hypothetical protein WBG46_14535 [Nonlabens sp.]
MRKIYALIICFTTAALSAQEELPESSTRKIEPVRETTSGGSLLFPEKEETFVFKRPDKKPTFSMRRETDLVDPGIQFKNQKFKKDRPMMAGFVSDTFLGELRTGEMILKLVCRDHQYEDGDMVRIWQDDKVLVNEIYLRNAYQGVNIQLKPGFNKLEIEALNQGSSGPNTAEFKVMDTTGKVIQQNVWNLSAGVKALLVVLQE